MLCTSGGALGSALVTDLDQNGRVALADLRLRLDAGSMEGPFTLRFVSI